MMFHILIGKVPGNFPREINMRHASARQATHREEGTSKKSNYATYFFAQNRSHLITL